MYWRIGKAILERQESEGWGRAVVDRLSDDLRAAFPCATGLSRRNLFYCAPSQRRGPQDDRHAPTVGILLCAGRNDDVVRYSPAGTRQALAIADYTYDALPAAIRAAVPTEAELCAALDEIEASVAHEQRVPRSVRRLTDQGV